MVTGISTSCFYPLETEKALALLVEAGAKNGEVFLNSFSELEEPYLRALDRAARAGGLGILSVHPFTSGWEGSLFFSGYPRRMEDGIDLYRRFFWGAALLGADKVIFHGAPLGMEIPMEEYARRYARLDQAARELGVRLCHENVCRTVSRSAAFFRELLRFCPGACGHGGPAGPCAHQRQRPRPQLPAAGKGQDGPGGAGGTAGKPGVQGRADCGAVPGGLFRRGGADRQLPVAGGAAGNKKFPLTVEVWPAVCYDKRRNGMGGDGR